MYTIFRRVRVSWQLLIQLKEGVYETLALSPQMRFLFSD